MDEDLPAGLRALRFPEARGRGYDAAVIDALVERLAAAREVGEPLRPIAVGAAMPVVVRGRRYQREVVDALLFQAVIRSERPPVPDGVTPAADEQVAQLEGVRFAPAFLRGYDMAVVDALLDRLAVAAAAGEPLAGLLAQRRLRIVRLRDTYAVDDVDAFLAGLEAAEGVIGA